MGVVQSGCGLIKMSWQWVYDIWVMVVLKVYMYRELTGKLDLKTIGK